MKSHAAFGPQQREKSVDPFAARFLHRQANIIKLRNKNGPNQRTTTVERFVGCSWFFLPGIDMRKIDFPVQVPIDRQLLHHPWVNLRFVQVE